MKGIALRHTSHNTALVTAASDLYMVLTLLCLSASTAPISTILKNNK